MKSNDPFGFGYHVTECGKVYSLKFNKVKRLKTYTGTSGYEQVEFCNKGKVKKLQIHRLVALIYCEGNNYSKTKVVNHLDGNKLNNNASNLEWCTYKQNEYHKRNVLKKHNNGEKNPKCKLKTVDVKRIRQLRVETGLSYKKIASRYQVSPQHIHKICTNQTRRTC